MKQYKKLLALGLVAFCLFSCGRKSESNNENNDNTQNNQPNDNNDPIGKPDNNDEPSHSHKMTHYPKLDPTCEEDGEREHFICSECGKYYWTPDGTIEILDTSDLRIERLGHDLKHFERHEATCEDDGNEEYYYCKRCENIYTDKECRFQVTDLSVLYISHYGHNLQYFKKVEPTCTKAGQREYWHCLTCEKNYWLPEGKAEIADMNNLVIDPIGHAKTEYILNDIDNHWYACARCNEKLDASEHVWDDGNEVVEGTCTSKHTTVFKCTICNEKKIDIEDPIGHDFSIIKSNDTEHRSECSRCHVVQEREKHSINSTTIREASCTQTGEIHHACSKCSYEYTETVEERGHDFKDTYEIDDNSHWRQCRNCSEKIDVVNHVWGNDRIIINPSFSEEGLKEVSCLYCNYKKEVTLAKSKFLFMLSNDETYYTLIGLASEENNLDIVIPSTYNNLPVKKIGDKAFKGCFNINSVIVPDSITEIGSYAFSETSLKSISLPNTIETIKYECFSFSSLLTIDIPDSVITIEDGAFSGCYNLTSVNMSNSVEKLGSCAFYYCSMLSDLTLSNRITILRAQTFERTGISTFVVNKSINYIESIAFRDCSNLRSVVFEDPNNWVCNGEPVNVNDSELNAYLLSKTFNDNAWFKNTEA